MPELIPCKTMFSNGTECEWFIETQCLKCTKWRQERCKIYRAIQDARIFPDRFPYEYLLDYAGGYAGKRCKEYSDIPKVYKRHDKPIPGQYELNVAE